MGLPPQESSAGPMAFRLALSETPELYGSIPAYYIAAGVTATCTRVRLSGTTRDFNVPPSEPCEAAEAGGTALTFRLVGFDGAFADGEVRVGSSDVTVPWVLVGTEGQVALVRFVIPAAPTGLISIGPDGMNPV